MEYSCASMYAVEVNDWKNMFKRNLNSCETTTTNHKVTKWSFSMSQELSLQENI